MLAPLEFIPEMLHFSAQHVLGSGALAPGSWLASSIAVYLWAPCFPPHFSSPVEYSPEKILASHLLSWPCSCSLVQAPPVPEPEGLCICLLLLLWSPQHVAWNIRKVLSYLLDIRIRPGSHWAKSRNWQGWVPFWKCQEEFVSCIFRFLEAPFLCPESSNSGLSPCHIASLHLFVHPLHSLTLPSFFLSRILCNLHNPRKWKEKRTEQNKDPLPLVSYAADTWAGCTQHFWRSLVAPQENPKTLMLHMGSSRPVETFIVLPLLKLCWLHGITTPAVVSKRLANCRQRGGRAGQGPGRGGLPLHLSSGAAVLGRPLGKHWLHRGPLSPSGAAVPS